VATGGALYSAPEAYAMNPTRRVLLIGAAGSCLLSRSTWAQQAKATPHIGWISIEAQPDPFIEGFREGLRRQGYVEGTNVILDVRYSPGNIEGLTAAVADLIERKVRLIVSSGVATRAVKGVEKLPVLFAISGDPVELGIANSLNKPGRNFTGSTFMSLEIAGKRVELIKEAVPRLGTLAVLSNVDHPGEPSERRATEAAAHPLGVTIAYVPFSSIGQLDAALDSVRQARPAAMIVFPESTTMSRRVKIAEFAVAHRLPSMFGWSEYVDAGGFMSYGANQRDTYVRLATYADRLLRGAQPADLPIEQPTRFELAINAKTAKALGLTIPPSVLLRADRVIE
jgi:putative tryptophan/tyrosine transport system substrate-binding protein